MKYFKETQKFNQWWLWLLIAFLFTIPIYTIIQYFFLKQISYIEISTIVSILLILGIVILFLKMKLTTFIDSDYIIMKYTPFLEKTIAWDEIESAKVINYGFAGGWGIRLGGSHGTVYNTRGNKGLAITLTNGEKFVIGTQRPEELKAYLSRIKN